MAYVVQGTSAGGTTVVERETAKAARDTAREMKHAGYTEIAVTCPEREECSMVTLTDPMAKEAA